MRALMWLQELVVDLLGRWPATHSSARRHRAAALGAGRRRANRTFERSARLVPPTGFPGRAPPPGTLSRGDPTAAFAAVPVMDKANYITRYSIADRCVHGRLPRRGVTVDESSGSSGRPTSWVRGPVERRASRELLQVGFARSAAGLRKPPFVINAFSLGAWATGMNVSASLTGLTVLKSTGPDRDKIINTMQEFGPDFTYALTSYPPFLKGLLDDDRLDWSRYDVVCAFGGEGISEGMRDHILRKARSVTGAYGASDLEISIAIATEFTIALRRAIAADPELSAALTRQAAYGVLPNIFQFNPYGYLIETNDAGELIITINRPQNINPRIRNNIHDRGHVLRCASCCRCCARSAAAGDRREAAYDLLLLHYGRSDLSVDYNGAVCRRTGCGM